MGVQEIFTALSDPTRLAIVEMLAKQGPLSVSVIKEPFNMSAPAISQHLKILRENRVVVVEKMAQQRIYQLNSDFIAELDEWRDSLSVAVSDQRKKIASLLA